MAEQQHARVAINWVQVLGSALAAVSSAVLLSTVGVAGTIIGAALGSIVVTAGGSIYTHYLEISRNRVAATQAVARARRTRARATGLDTKQQERADDELHRAEEQLAAAGDEKAKPSWRELLAGLRWRHIAAAAAVVFVVAMAIIVTFEVVTGRAVSTYTGGSDGQHPRTSIPGLGGGSSPSTPDRSPTPNQTPTATQTGSPSPTATSSASPTTTPSATATTPAPTTGVPSPTPTVAGTESTAPTGPRTPTSSAASTPTAGSSGSPRG